MKIEDRILDHEINLRKSNNKKDILEEELYQLNKKIIFHGTAIWNLQIKLGKKEQK